jgi:hypothetical protein
MLFFLRSSHLALLLTLLTSCRNPPQGSRLQTLENVGTRTGIFEACAGSGQIHPKSSLDQEAHLKFALGAVPYKIQESFFDDLGGRIRITQANECTTTNQRQDDTLGCWKRLPSAKQSVEIIIKRTSKAKEQYALVRTFGFIYGDLLLNRVIPSSPLDPVKITTHPQEGLGSYKIHLASIFLGELYSFTESKNRKELMESLSEFGIPSTVTAEKDFERRWKMFTMLPVQVQNNFASRVFAESFHSQFCSVKSSKRACTSFPLTMQSFEPYFQDISTKKEQASLACGSKQVKTESATHLEFYNLNRDALHQRKTQGRDTGAYVNSQIAKAVEQKIKAQKNEAFSLHNDDQPLNLNSNFLEQLLGLITGGISNGGGGGSLGGLGGLLGPLLGGMDNGGLEGLGNLGDLLGSLGLGGLMDDNGGNLDDNPGGGETNNNMPSNDTPLPSGGNATKEEQAGMDATNRYRQSQGKSVLQIDQQMVEDCRKQAQLQAQKGGLTHYLYPAGVSRAENIAYGSKSGEYTVMQQWVKSPGHHRNIMANHRFIGIGNYGNQWCQRFR